MEWFNQLLMNAGLKVMDFGDDITAWSELDSAKESVGLELHEAGYRIFQFGYENSDQEIQDALDFSEEEWPTEKMNNRQVEARRNAPEDSIYF